MQWSPFHRFPVNEDIQLLLRKIAVYHNFMHVNIL